MNAIARRFSRFAGFEARGHSALYECLAERVASDMEILDFLTALPVAKQQPNLLFAATRLVCGAPVDWSDFRSAFAAHVKAIREVMLSHRTQTNEPARCAVLLPSFARLPQPLALIEVGASAGLCLLPDRYGYAYSGQQPFGPEPRFICRASAATPLPSAVPVVAWRAGIDLNPLDLRDKAAVTWLETLVWPDQPARLAGLRAAIRVAEFDPPRVVKGDLLHSVASLAANAPPDATLVIFHTAVLAYVAGIEARRRFAAANEALNATWISNEAPSVFPEIAARLDAPGPPGAFPLAVNGKPEAWTDPHGAWIEWIDR